MNASANIPISEQFRIVAKKYVDADAAANMLEESKSAVLAKLMLAQGDMPVSRAEMNVKDGSRARTGRASQGAVGIYQDAVFRMAERSRDKAR
jgi:phosphoenolpyruvate carboxylase